VHSLRRRPRLLEDADDALAEAEQQLENLQTVSAVLKYPLSKREKTEEIQEKLISTEKRDRDEIPDQEQDQNRDHVIFVGSVHHNPEVLKYNVTPAKPSHHEPITFTSKRSDSNATDENTGRIHLDFESDFKTGYRKVKPAPEPSKEPESPWLNVTTPEEEAGLEEEELAKKIAETENRTATALDDPTADKDTTRDLLMITRLEKKSQKLMDQLNQLMSLQGAESAPEVIAEAQKLLAIYNKMKKQISDAVMKYSSFKDFENGYRSSNDTLTFPMENPRQPPGQMDVVHTKKSHRRSTGFQQPITLGGPAETVYTPLEKPQKPVIE